MEPINHAPQSSCFNPGNVALGVGISLIVVAAVAAVAAALLFFSWPAVLVGAATVLGLSALKLGIGAAVVGVIGAGLTVLGALLNKQSTPAVAPEPARMVVKSLEGPAPEVIRLKIRAAMSKNAAKFGPLQDGIEKRIDNSHFIVYDQYQSIPTTTNHLGGLKGTQNYVVIHQPQDNPPDDIGKVKYPNVQGVIYLFQRDGELVARSVQVEDEGHRQFLMKIFNLV